MAAVSTYSYQSQQHPHSPDGSGYNYANAFGSHRDVHRPQQSSDQNGLRAGKESSSPKLTPHGRLAARSSCEDDIIDIRLDKASPVSLHTQTLDALSAPEGQKFLPSLLVWNEEGQKHYHDVLFGGDYYPFHIENYLISKHANSIASKIVSSGSTILVELGAGSMQKTGVLLRALDAMNVPITYYALDVDRGGLSSSIESIRSRQMLKNIRLRGLLGTYEDGARWLATTPEVQAAQKSFVWLGTSMGNCTPAEASSLLQMFSETQENIPSPNFVIAVDGCMEEDKLYKAYDSPSGSNRRFIRSALSYGIEVLGKEAEDVLSPSKWLVKNYWNKEKRIFESSLQPCEDLSATVDGKDIRISKHEQLPVISSRKWNRADIQRICELPGLQAAHAWSDASIDYSKFLDPPSQRRIPADNCQAYTG